MRAKLIAFGMLGMAFWAGQAMAKGSGSPVQVDNSLRTPAFQPLGPDYQVSVENHGLLSGNGRNAFFSFGRFDVPAGSTVSFTGPLGVRNVLARVTGGSASTINGQVRSDMAGASFYLMNPNGIIVGKGGSFDVSGSLILTTADELRFKDAAFSAQGGNAPAALLSAANPAAFGFLKRAPAKISVNGLAALGAPAAGTGKTVSLVGGDLSLSDSTFHAAAGRINLVAVGGAGEVKMDAGLRSGLTISPGMVMGNISLEKESELDLGDGGSLFVRGNDFSMDHSTISARSEQTAGKKTLAFDLTGAFTMTNQSLITADTLGAQSGANIRVNAAAIQLSEDSRVQANVGQPNDDGLNARISAQNLLATGRAGNINLSAGSLTIEDLAFVSAFAFGPGRGADIGIDVSGQATMTGPVASPRRPEKFQALFTGVIAKTDDQADASASGGVISLRASELTLARGAELASTTKTARRAGDVLINSDRILIDGAGRQSLTGVEARAGDADAATGAGGDIVVHGFAGGESAARLLTLRDDAALSASTFGRGVGGNVRVYAKRIEMQGVAGGFTGLFARSAAVAPALGAAGDGGNVEVFAGDVHMTNDASISASSRGAGNAGSVTVHATHVTLDHATLGAAAKRSPSAGDVTVDGGRSVTLLNNSALTTQALQDGGNIHIRARDVVRVDHSLLTAQSGASGKTLTIDPMFVVLNAATINGVDLNRTLTVTIDAANFLRSPDSEILTSLPPRLPPDIDLSNKVVPLESATLDISSRLLESCSLRVGAEGISSFLVVGRGGTPIEPGGVSPALGKKPAR